MQKKKFLHDFRYIQKNNRENKDVLFRSVSFLDSTKCGCGKSMELVEVSTMTNPNFMDEDDTAGTGWMSIGFTEIGAVISMVQPTTDTQQLIQMDREHTLEWIKQMEEVLKLGKEKVMGVQSHNHN